MSDMRLSFRLLDRRTKRIIRVFYFFERYVRTITYSILAYAYPRALIVMVNRTVRYCDKHTCKAWSSFRSLCYRGRQTHIQSCDCSSSILLSLICWGGSKITPRPFFLLSFRKFSQIWQGYKMVGSEQVYHSPASQYEKLEFMAYWLFYTS